MKAELALRARFQTVCLVAWLVAYAGCAAPPPDAREPREAEQRRLQERYSSRKLARQDTQARAWARVESSLAKQKQQAPRQTQQQVTSGEAPSQIVPPDQLAATPEPEVQAVEAAPAQVSETEELPRGQAVPAATGAFHWSKAGYASSPECEMWTSETFTLSIDEQGGAQWSTFANSSVSCSGGTNVPTNCGTKGSGFLELVGKQVRLVTTYRSRFGGGGTALVTSVWQCGRLKVHAPIDWQPSGAQQASCRRLGSEPDSAIERASEAACQYSEQFPELNELGADLTIKADSISFLRDGKSIRLKRAKPKR